MWRKLWIRTIPSVKESVIVPLAVESQKTVRIFVVLEEGIQTAELGKEILEFANAKVTAGEPHQQALANDLPAFGASTLAGH
jgi:hypothetical protein